MTTLITLGCLAEGNFMEGFMLSKAVIFSMILTLTPPQPATIEVPIKLPEPELVMESVEYVIEDVTYSENRTYDEQTVSLHLTEEGGSFYHEGRKETYYNLEMGRVVQTMRNKGYSEEDYPYHVREDGCKMLGDYIIVAARLDLHPRGVVVETSLGQGIVCDTGEFTEDLYDIAVNW